MCAGSNPAGGTFIVLWYQGFSALPPISCHISCHFVDLAASTAVICLLSCRALETPRRPLFHSRLARLSVAAGFATGEMTDSATGPLLGLGVC